MEGGTGFGVCWVRESGGNGRGKWEIWEGGGGGGKHTDRQTNRRTHKWI